MIRNWLIRNKNSSNNNSNNNNDSSSNNKIHRMKRRSIRSLVFLVFLLSTTTTLAQQDNNRDYDNFYQDYYYNNNYSNNNKNYYYDYESGGGSYSNDNLYTDYAARQNEKILNNKTVGWVKLALAGIGGYWLGATITTATTTTTTTTRKKKKTNKHNRNRNDDDDVPKLRFPIHQKVDCKIGLNNNEWETGIVIKLWYEEPQGVWNPYQIQLDNGSVIYAPADNDRVVRISNRS